MRIAWGAGLPDGAALPRLLAAGARPALAPTGEARRVVPPFLLEEQAAALGLSLAEGPGEHAPGTLREALRLGLRGFVVAARPPAEPSLLGRFVDEDLLPEAERLGDAVATLLVDGPLLRRRVDAMAGDVVPFGPGWRLELGLRGC